MLPSVGNYLFGGFNQCMHTYIHIYIYIYIYIYEEMVDFDKSDEKIKISEKVDKLTLTSDSAMIFRSFFRKRNVFSKFQYRRK